MEAVNMAANRVSIHCDTEHPHDRDRTRGGSRHICPSLVYVMIQLYLLKHQFVFCWIQIWRLRSGPSVCGGLLSRSLAHYNAKVIITEVIIIIQKCGQMILKVRGFLIILIL